MIETLTLKQILALDHEQDLQILIDGERDGSIARWDRVNRELSVGEGADKEIFSATEIDDDGRMVLAFEDGTEATLTFRLDINPVDLIADQVDKTFRAGAKFLLVAIQSGLDADEMASELNSRYGFSPEMVNACASFSALADRRAQEARKTERAARRARRMGGFMDEGEDE